MAPVQLLAPAPGDFVLDLCAAPGGKSTQIAAALKGQGFLLSNEIHPARAKILSQNMERMGIAGAAVTCQDGKSLAGWFPGFFDKVMVDAPCSGEGMFRKDEEAAGEWSPASPLLCQKRQQEILSYAAEMLKPGGRLVYSTCTFSPEEDEESITLFLENHRGFSLREGKFYQDYQGFSRGNPAWVSGGGNPEVEKTYRAWPHRTAGEGHYFALLQKEDTGNPAEGAGREKRKPKGRKGEENLWKEVRDPERRKAFREFCRETLLVCPREGGPFSWEIMPGRYLLFGEQLYYVHQAFKAEAGMKILRPGLHLGEYRKNRFEPSHALALSLKPEQVQWTVDFAWDSGEISGYLKGEALPARRAGRKGWGLVTVDGFSLGWVKQAGNTLKNHYPKGLRKG